MDEGASPRRSSSSRPNGRGGLYRLNSNQSSSSIFEDVEMAHDELYAGPVAESLPSSISAFAHRRRTRADSTTSFTFHDDDDQPNEEALIETDDYPDRESYLRHSISDIGDLEFGVVEEEEEDDDSADRGYDATPDDYLLHRRSSTLSRGSVRAHLLRRDSTATNGSGWAAGRSSQKLYMKNEDLTIAIAGFRTSRFGYALYLLVSVLTCGVGYLLFRWMPKWYVTVVGRPSSLRHCDWVVIENEWAEMVILRVKTQTYGRPVSSVFGLSEKQFSDGFDEESDPLIDNLRTLDYRYVRFCFHPLKDKFVLSSGWKDPEWTDVRLLRSGLDSDDKAVREILFGNNLIDIEQKPMGQLLVDEVLHPFYIFQIASLILWSMDSYYYYAVCIFLISVGSITTTLIETRATMRRLREISRFECDVRVLRNGFWRYISSSDLVPGDIYEVSDPNLTQFPSDSLLLSGDSIVNESMLTGESVPVSKLPATDETLLSMDLAASSVSPEIARHFLFCGTRIIRTRRPQEDQDGDAVALALVVRTGFNTTKGALVRSMLFPKPSGFKFYQDSFRYIGVMAIVAILGFIASLINFVRLGVEWHVIIVRALDLITIVVPPALPATLTIGTGFAISRLKTKQIFCISPQRVNVGGKLDIMCFDKTGTLTEDGLDVLGVRVVSRESNSFTEVISERQALSGEGSAPNPNSTLQAVLHTMATCHSLRSVDGELVGDPLDQKMFEFTNWTFTEGKQSAGDAEDEEHGGLSPSVARPPDESLELGVLKSFEFVSQLRRASVIVRRFGQRSGDIFVKGAPEAMREICKPDTFPKDYEERLSFYTHKGYRVIACATRHLKKLSWVKAQKMTRAEVESDLDFVGFIIFENKLKPTTAGVIKELLDSNIGTVMVTGDNILTAISVARECELMDRSAHCFVPRFVEGDFRDPEAKLCWESIDNPVFGLDTDTLTPLPPPPEGDASLPYDITNLRNYALAVSGDVFRWIVDYAPPEVLRRMLVQGKVFARMSPDEKHELIEKLQSIDYTCGFCGDGANDCGALKAADVGISLSEAEASVAAPFTSRVFDIRCVLEVIREGRAALVTSFSCFKYMSLYSAIQFTSVSFLYAKASNLGDFQFLYIDLALIVPLAIFMGWSGPAIKLHRKRPIADLVSRKVLTPLLGLMVLSVAIQAVAYVVVKKQSWYIPPKVRHDKPHIKNSENSALFLTSCFEYIFSAVILNAGPPFRERTAKNWPFSLSIVIALLVSAYMVFAPADWLKKLMQLTKTSRGFQVFIVFLGVVYVVVGWIFERYISGRVVGVVGSLKQRMNGKAKKRKAYKTLIMDSSRSSSYTDWLLDGGFLPHTLIRLGIRHQLTQRLASIASASFQQTLAAKMAYVARLRTLPMAIETDAANSQHYEVGAGVLEGCLGPRMKYSCCLYEKGGETLAQAEVAMLKSYMVKADLRDGMRILDLGCGWGSGAIFFAEMMPNSSVTAFSNSKSQKEYIDGVAKEKGLSNIEVITGNVVDYEFEPSSFDRVISIELFEHMKNYDLLMDKVARALKPGGKLFVHTFAHRHTPYDYEDDGSWMATHFFTGGTMPSADLLLYFQPSALHVRGHWWLDGTHYARTCEDWLARMLRNKAAMWPSLVATYGTDEAARVWWNRWQVFYMACAEMFAYGGGEHWGVVHYLFEKDGEC